MCVTQDVFPKAAVGVIMPEQFNISSNLAKFAGAWDSYHGFEVSLKLIFQQLKAFQF